MISTLTGRVSEKLEELVVIDVAGVGYGLLVCAEDFGKLTTNSEVKLYVYEHIREQSYDLFGFTNLTTKKLFEQLLSVKNVGPKVALAVLDIGSSDTVRAAIAGGDVKRLQSAKGVGKRAAEQMVVELRDKVGVVVGGDAENIVGRSGIDQNDEAAQALVALGYTEADAQTALAKIDKDLPLEARVKEALKG
jgi:holliday junction DNA helicase RuvA